MTTPAGVPAASTPAVPGATTTPSAPVVPVVTSPGAPVVSVSTTSGTSGVPGVSTPGGYLLTFYGATNLTANPCLRENNSF